MLKMITCQIEDTPLYRRALLLVLATTDRGQLRGAALAKMINDDIIVKNKRTAKCTKTEQLERDSHCLVQL